MPLDYEKWKSGKRLGKYYMIRISRDAVGFENLQRFLCRNQDYRTIEKDRQKEYSFKQEKMLSVYINKDKDY